ncbi:carbamoyltransferase HypF [Limisphaera sp. 4302-co]|uniref:carbamoyltransferase HypF n=1 Tax=Limisphaera sp. 4302-co TaxID=3400417 RepID=UPI003C1795A3
MERLRLLIRGVVQGVGFRPFVHRLATELGLNGWVRNTAQGVVVEVEGPRPALERFLERLPAERPPHSSLQSVEPSWLDPAGYTRFEIRPSDAGGALRAVVMPDIATCGDCLRELWDPRDRRYLYPFLNCTHCGPRYSILLGLPYDRPQTTMAGFVMCDACRHEYEDPANRRFHAQPNACPRCGPHLELWSPEGTVLGTSRPPGEETDPGAHARATRALIRRTAEALRSGAIVAVKGLGGFHLMVRAGSDEAVARLRTRKRREAKPLALMFPRLEMVRQVCHLSAAEERVLTGPEAPILLLDRRRHPDPEAPGISEQVAPGNPTLGVMLPYTPLHHLLLAELGEPVVATSGNLSEEPICTDEREALQRLAGIADLFLVHNRPIARHVDDSVVRVVEGREMLLRRARGFAPLPLPLGGGGKGAGPAEVVVLAAGAHLKNTVGLAVGGQAFLSQHIGDLETAAAEDAWLRVARDLPALYEARPSVVMTDLHPDYGSTRLARRLFFESVGSQVTGQGMPRARAVQHHVAHVLAVMVENEVRPPALGVAWDGTGLGWDGSIWGGEFFRVEPGRVHRVGTFRPFRIPGGDAAAREPRRAALGLLHELSREDPALEPVARGWAARRFAAAEWPILWRMLAGGIRSPWCSSVGRLFDAVASLAGLRDRNRFEAQAAMELEFRVNTGAEWNPYPLPLREPAKTGGPWVLDWGPTIRSVLADVEQGTPPAGVATRFHQALVTGIVNIARVAGCESVLLGGGCFQNRHLLSWAVRELRRAGFRPYWPQRVPPNDGGIALGQLAAYPLGLDEPAPL